jgi:hypothetical protein
MGHQNHRQRENAMGAKIGGNLGIFESFLVLALRAFQKLFEANRQTD